MTENIKIRVSCPEGWTYISWQRIVIEMVELVSVESVFVTRNVSQEVGQLLYFTLAGTGCDHHVTKDCIFVESGESFGLSDFAEMVRDMFRFPVEVIDGVREC